MIPTISNVFKYLNKKLRRCINIREQQNITIHTAKKLEIEREMSKLYSQPIFIAAMDTLGYYR